MERVFTDYATDLELEMALDQMDLLLVEAKLKSREKDFTEQDKRMEILRKFREKWLVTREDNRVLNELVFKVTKDFHLMDEKIRKLEEENKNLKLDIIL